MLNHFPRYFTTRAIICYLLTLAVVSVAFMSYALPFQFVMFGVVAILVFFIFSNRLTMNWAKLPSRNFTKKLFVAALLIRLVYVAFIYFYYIEMTGKPYAYHPGDELLYQGIASLWREEGMESFLRNMDAFIEFSDSGYCWWLALEYFVFGTHVLPARLVKCVIDAFTCVLMYNLAKRNFGEAAGRMTGVFCMLMPNLWSYCGVTLKETEMLFLVVIFVERADLALRAEKITFRNIILPGVAILVLFSFRTALAAVAVAALVGALILSSGKQLQTWKKILYSAVFAVWMLLTVGAEMVEETRQLWEGREINQMEGYAWRAEEENGNTFAQYATATVFAPLIFTIPFSSMVAVHEQENMMMMNGANFIKNILSGFVIYVLITLLVSGRWRRHVLPIAVTCGYLLVLVFSNFAHSERFHFPVLAFELMFAAYGVTLMENKHKRWFNIWLAFMCVANVIWCWIKLAGRGLL